MDHVLRCHNDDGWLDMFTVLMCEITKVDKQEVGQKAGRHFALRIERGTFYVSEP